MTVKLQGFEMLFPTPLWYYAVENHEDLNRRLLIEIAARRKVEADRSDRNLGWLAIRARFVQTH